MRANVNDDGTILYCSLTVRDAAGVFLKLQQQRQRQQLTTYSLFAFCVLFSACHQQKLRSNLRSVIDTDNVV